MKAVVLVVPVHGDLDDLVELGQRSVGVKAKSAPDHRAHPVQGNLKSERLHEYPLSRCSLRGFIRTF